MQQQYSRRMFLGTVGAAAVAGPLTFPYRALAQAKRDRMNVLFIPVDDLRPELGCYGRTHIHSPNIDRLASQGTTFTRTYCQVATCGASRASLLTGHRPDTIHAWHNNVDWRERAPDIATLPQHFKNNGYTTVGFGKNFHNGQRHIDPPSWTRYDGKWSAAEWQDAETVADMERRKKEANQKGLKGLQRWKYSNGPAWEAWDAPDDAYRDGKLTVEALKEIRGFADGGESFFLSVGYFKPHLPYVCPKKYWDLYDPAKLELARNPIPPIGAEFALPGFPGEPSQYSNIRKILDDLGEDASYFSEETARTLIHGYYACVSYIDAQVGMLIDELKRTGLWDNTMVVLWGDHGFHLGDNGTWDKHCNLEASTHSPMIVRVPGQANRGAKCDALTEFVDIYPSVAELAGLDIPAHCEGLSYAPLISNPARSWKTAAFSQYKRWAKGTECMGYAMRTRRYRYEEYRAIGDDTPADNDVVTRTLFDYELDPLETRNWIDDPAHAETVRELAQQMARATS